MTFPLYSCSFPFKLSAFPSSPKNSRSASQFLLIMYLVKTSINFPLLLTVKNISRLLPALRAIQSDNRVGARHRLCRKKECPAFGIGRSARTCLVSYTTPDAPKQAPVRDTMRLCLLLSVAAVIAAVAADSRRVVVKPAVAKNSWKPHKPQSLQIASELKSPQQQRGARNTNFAGQNSYGAPSEPSEPVDLHNKEFCVDVSTYQPVVWVEREAESCETVFVKQCSDRSENVCQDVTETKCEVRKQ